MRAVLAARDMTAERRGAAALDRRHRLELAEAHMAGVGLPPRRAAVAEDIRDLQDRTAHVSRASGGRPSLLELDRDMLERAHHRADRFSGDPGIERGGVELGVAEQDLDDAHSDVLFAQVRRKAVPPRMDREI